MDPSFFFGSPGTRLDQIQTMTSHTNDVLSIVNIPIMTLSRIHHLVLSNSTVTFIMFVFPLSFFAREQADSNHGSSNEFWRNIFSNRDFSGLQEIRSGACLYPQLLMPSIDLYTNFLRLVILFFVVEI